MQLRPQLLFELNYDFLVWGNFEAEGMLLKNIV